MLTDLITSGKVWKPPRVFLYGTEGIGKSTFAAGSPKPIFVPTEDGLDRIDCDRLPLSKSFDQFYGYLGSLYTEEHDYKTVVIDSVDWLERLVWQATCERFGVSNIEKVDGGYSKGYTHCLDEWRRILKALDMLRNEKGMGVLLIAHAKVEKFDDPESSSYDRYSPRLHKNASSLFTEWADAICFATRRFRTKTEDAGFNKQRTIAVEIGADGGERVLRTTGSPVCVAKNRYNLPSELKLSWEEFYNAVKKGE